MARRPRYDEPGSWHHVVNRALSKRPYFETRDDQRAFLASLAREVRRGRIRVHAFCLMTTHFHLLVESPGGELSEAMRVVENTYSRRFNRLRGRDGPLVRARFHSKRVRTDAYRRAVVRYVDRNPVTARIVERPEDYEFCSASSHMSGLGRPWLERAWIAQSLVDRFGTTAPRAAAYIRVFGSDSTADSGPLEQLVEARMQSRSELDPLDDLIGAKPAAVRSWLAQKAILADGEQIGLPVCTPTVLLRSIATDVERHGPWYVPTEELVLRGDEVASVGLLRDLCAATWQQVVRLREIPTSRARWFHELHQRLMCGPDTYGERVGRISSGAVRELFGSERHEAADG